MFSSEFRDGLDDDRYDDEDDGYDDGGWEDDRRQGRWFSDDRNLEDRSLGSIKMKIPSFQVENDPEAYLESEKKLELVFDYHQYSKTRKV